ncbi:MAG: hypothetical protein OXI91_13525 [Chloroflexota bacterium]|nr:hypothetical protein [Chloroflexota bacterium]
MLAVGIALFILSVVVMVAIFMLAVVPVAYVGGLFLDGGRVPLTSGGSSGSREEYVQTRFGPRRKSDL